MLTLLKNLYFFGVFYVDLQKNISPAELRTISLCDSDLLIKNYKANHRKLSEHSPEVSYYSGTESQQSISERSYYDNVDIETQSRNILLPPVVTFKNSLVNRSRSFQEPGQCHKFLSPRANLLIRRKLHDSNSFEAAFNRSSVSPGGSTLSESVVDCSDNRKCHSGCQCNKIEHQTNCSCDKKRTDPFFIKIFRRMQKLSLQWRKCKKVHRGRFPFLAKKKYINNKFGVTLAITFTNPFSLSKSSKLV